MRPTRAFATLALLPLALAGCGNSGNSGATTSATAGSATSASASSSGGNAYAMCDKPGELDKNAFLDNNKKSQSDVKTFHMEMTAEQAGATGSASAGASASGSASSTPSSSSTGEALASGDVDGNDPANPKMRLTMKAGAAGGSGGEIILVGQDLYLNGGAATGGKYIKTSASQLGIDLDAMRDPSGQFEKQRDAIQSITCVGREDVGGVKTAHYRIVVDPAKAAAASGRTATATGSASMPASVDTDMWVDEKSRPIKSTTNAGPAYVVITFSKWNEPVTVNVPAVTQVTTMPGMPGGAGATKGTATGAATSATAG